ncbi:Crp/Fnr family transcriptional regulator [Romboutsia ilealis]|uniref:Transcriptional regulator, Crp family n=1 Tax=Romboutsia ilealis TaxID=1115758 RepID=A0A1V1I127_9FIRM|nr:Crp/Fnr family transcriptional regulator [Romboutsia ilealis]CED93920.1 Transcriptional regulator, Crp family [Romboutsia ilealis]
MNNSLLYKYLENQDAKDFIEKIPINIKNKCKLRKIEKGKLLVLKGNNIEYIYIHCQGKMQVKNEFENGFVYSFANIKPIAYIGAMEIMANKQTYSSTLQTTTECIILEMQKIDFKNWINTDHKLTLKVLNFVSSRMYEQSLKTGEVLAYPAICILTNYLINVFESQDKDVVFLEKTREEIGSILGFSVRTINRNLKELKDENLITVNRKGISITKEQFDKLLNKLESIK